MTARKLTIAEVFEAAQDVSFIMTDLAGKVARVLEWSPGAERLFGFSRDEMLGQLVARVHLPDDVERFPEVFAAMAARNSGFSGEATLIRKSGECFSALFTSYPICDEQGTMVAALGISVDISERKRIEEALRQKSEELEAMFAATHVLTAVLDTSLRFVRVNPAYCASAQKSAEDLVGRRHFELYPNEENERLFRRVLETGEPYTVTAKPFEYPDQPERGTTYWDWTVSPIKGATGPVEGVVLTLVDATERERRRMEAEHAFRCANLELERRVQQRTHKLQEVVEELKAFSYSVSHDLSAPLRAINGFVHLLKEECGDQLDGPAVGYLERIAEATRQMDSLMLGLLQLSRLSRTEIERGPVDMAPMAHKIVDELRAMEPERDVTFICPASLPAHADVQLVRVALNNLLANAWKFTSRKQRAVIELGGATVEGEPVYWVRDNGAGFEMAYAEKLYGAFQRLHDSDEFPGSGIGLATVARAVRAHGGRIWAEAELDKGAVFYFTLGEDSAH